MKSSVLSTLPDTKCSWHPTTLHQWCYSWFPLARVFFLNLYSCLAVTRPLFHVMDKLIWWSSISALTGKLGQVLFYPSFIIMFLEETFLTVDWRLTDTMTANWTCQRSSSLRGFVMEAPFSPGRATFSHKSLRNRCALWHHSGGSVR